MSPAEVYDMTDDEYAAFLGFMREEARARERAAKRKR